ncbi:MAG TPA: ATP-binding protein [Blastocatellia bacterium]|nr:ATP-binding protein [Blastocatellia bacterium]HMV86896.1 ATP-binding protein [Blastocatellia bacterium]HMX28681.1 ATP-binding protein [Blastocatellia bacterium]HMZ18803.1 ATP-binding protein [Blastocatellia bacterium]HNG29830.1 ATP-binding protein [Blastocatellia bacterium]
MAAIERKFNLQVPSSTENLALIREFVTSVGRQATLGEEEISKLELAVDEACANVIEHAYGHDTAKAVSVRAVFDDEKLLISVIDEGRGFDPTQVQSESVEQLVHERASGGLGLRLIRTLMDEVKYEIVPGEKNELHMTKRIKK